MKVDKLIGWHLDWVNAYFLRVRLLSACVLLRGVTLKCALQLRSKRYR